MNVCVREIIEAFPDREVTLTTRPDGRLSLTIVGAAQPAFHRVIDCDAVLSRAQVGSLIDQLVEDVRAGADSRQPGQGARWLARGLPTTAVVPPSSLPGRPAPRRANRASDARPAEGIAMEHFLIVKDHQEWACRRFGSLENLFSSASKADVICMAAAQVGHLQSSVKIHGEDGALEEERIYPLLSGDPLRYL